MFYKSPSFKCYSSHMYKLWKRRDNRKENFFVRHQNACTRDTQRQDNKSYTYTAWKHGSRVMAIRQKLNELHCIIIRNRLSFKECVCLSVCFRRAVVSLFLYLLYFVFNILHSTRDKHSPDGQSCVRKCAAINTCKEMR